jgi:hypothetical protein
MLMHPFLPGSPQALEDLRVLLEEFLVDMGFQLKVLDLLPVNLVNPSQLQELRSGIFLPKDQDLKGDTVDLLNLSLPVPLGHPVLVDQSLLNKSPSSMPVLKPPVAVAVGVADSHQVVMVDTTKLKILSFLQHLMLCDLITFTANGIRRLTVLT